MSCAYDLKHKSNQLEHNNIREAMLNQTISQPVQPSVSHSAPNPGAIMRSTSWTLDGKEPVCIHWPIF